MIRHFMSEPSTKRGWYVVCVLLLVYVFSFIDRQILGLLVAPIRRDLEISETQMGLLMGFTFAIFYTFFGIPLGRLADTKSRRGIIALGLAAWSLFTTGCGFVRNFAQMALMRMGVGVGEATLSPAAYSLIVDYFPPRMLATAMAVYNMGIAIGSGMAFLLGGLVVKFASAKEKWVLPIAGETNPWQVIFFLVGLPGLACVVLLFTFPEPPRRGLMAHHASYGEGFAYLKKHLRAFLCLNIGFGLHYVASYSASSWTASYFIRVHGWTAGEFGIWFGFATMIFGSLGMLTGGRLSDRMSARGRREGTLIVARASMLITIPIAVAAYLAPNSTVAMCLVAAHTFFLLLVPGIAPAAIQQMMPPNLRGQGAAIYLFIVNLLGLGIGPVATGWLTQHVFANDKLIHYSMTTVAVAAGLAAVVILTAGIKPFVAAREQLDTPAPALAHQTGA